MELNLEEPGRALANPGGTTEQDRAWGLWEASLSTQLSGVSSLLLGACKP